MANFFEHKERRVIPNWRSFGKTTVLGELDSFQVNQTLVRPETNIDEYVIDWQLNKSVVHAADLLSAGIVNNKKDNQYVVEAARFVLNNRDKASRSQVLLAESILNNDPINNLLNSFNEVKLESLSESVNIDSIKMKIKESKELLKVNPANPIVYVELSRYYSILGQEISAIKAMRTALHLFPNNRFILRCATRLFIHYADENNDYLDYIHNFLRNSPLTSYDPWLTSTEISIATVRGRNSKFIKKGIDLVNSKNISPFNFTELASSIGTVELLNGSGKKSREFFNKSLIHPNDNSLAQLEWASTKDNQIEIDPLNFNVKMNFEALALDSFHNNKFDQSLEHAAKWFVDMPFSKRAIMFGSNLSSTILKDQSKAISFLNAGLISHPSDPQLINNLAYSLSLDGRPNEAFAELEKIKNVSEYDEITRACLTATQGLTFFRKGMIDIGRKLYLDAIDQTKTIGNRELNWIAVLNYAREEILINSEYVESLIAAVNQIPATKDVEINVVKKDILDLYEKTKK